MPNNAIETMPDVMNICSNDMAETADEIHSPQNNQTMNSDRCICTLSYSNMRSTATRTALEDSITGNVKSPAIDSWNAHTDKNSRTLRLAESSNEEIA